MHLVGLIPAAGKGTRLAPLPFSKELFPLGYQRLMVDGKMQWRLKVVSQYLIDSMVQAGVERIFIILGAGKHPIMEYYGNGSRWGIQISYLFQEELAGMPFALDLARGWLRDETILFGMPDTVIQPADFYVRLLKRHEEDRADLTLAAFRTDTPQKFGMIEIDRNNRVINNVDKPRSTHLKYMWGAACWSPRFSELMGEYLKLPTAETKEIVLANVFQYAIDQGLAVNAVCFDEGEYIDIGTVEELNFAIARYSRMKGE